MEAEQDPEGFSAAVSSPPPSCHLKPFLGKGFLPWILLVLICGISPPVAHGMTYAARRISDKIIYSAYEKEGGMRAQA